MSFSGKARVMFIVLAGTARALAGAEDLRGPETFASITSQAERSPALFVEAGRDLQGARLAVGLEQDARRGPRAGAGRSGTGRRVDRRVDRVRSRLHRILPTDAAARHRSLNEELCMSVTLNINGTRREFDGDPDTPLLWVIREDLGLTGTKYGCGIAQCGACTVHLDGQTLRSCSAPVSVVAGRQVTTIEGVTS